MIKTTYTLLAALVLGAGSLLAWGDDPEAKLEELREQARRTNSQLDDEANKLRREALFEKDTDRWMELKKAASRIEDSKIDLY
jgi:F0F1-type ATP synthase membrane subunit b/b'